MIIQLCNNNNVWWDLNFNDLLMKMMFLIKLFLIKWFILLSEIKSLFVMFLNIWLSSLLKCIKEQHFGVLTTLRRKIRDKIIYIYIYILLNFVIFFKKYFYCLLKIVSKNINHCWMKLSQVCWWLGILVRWWCSSINLRSRVVIDPPI